MIKTAVVTWAGGSRFTGEAGSGHRVSMDSEEGGTAVRPTELPLVGLGGCTAMDVVEILRKKRQVVSTYSVFVEAQQRESHPKVFTDIVVEHRVSGDPLDPAAVARAIELSATRYCSVTAVIATGVARIVHRYVVRNIDGEHHGEVVVTGPAGLNVSGVGDASIGSSGP